MVLRMTFSVIVSILGAWSWYREHLGFERGKGLFHILSPEHGDWLLLIAAVVLWGSLLALVWREGAATGDARKPGPPERGES